MKKIAVISAIIEEPQKTQKEFNEIISYYKNIVKGRMGLPMEDIDIAVVSISVLGTMDEINSLTGKLGKLINVTVKTAVSKKDIL